MLCLCLLAAALPTATLAADPHDHTWWTELTAESIQTYVSVDDKYALGDGNYYLGENVQGDFTVDGTVTLCLNGFTLTGTGTDSVIIVTGGTFTLTDCSEGEIGKVTGGHADLRGGGVLVAYSDEAYVAGGVTFNMERGNITGKGAGRDGVYIYDGTELNAGVVRTAETAAMGSTDISNLKTLVYVSVGIAGVSLAGMIGMLVYLFVKRKLPIGN